MSKTWVVVAESARARFFATEHANGPLTELADMTHPESRQHSRDITSDLPGAGFDGIAGRGQHAMTGKQDVKKHELEVFAKQIAERLKLAHANGEFDALRISAPPAFLGELRQHLSPAVRDMVLREVDKDLVRESEDTILAHLF